MVSYAPFGSTDRADSSLSTAFTLRARACRPPASLPAIALALWWYVCGVPAGATTVDPFFAQVPVSDTGPEARTAGYRMALAQVLVKLSGDPAAVNALAQAPGLGPADPLVRQHRYLEAPPAAEPLPPQTLLEVRFNPTRIRDRARDLGLPLWPLERPATLVWVAVERPDRQRSLLGTEEQDAAALEALEKAARERALPLVLPLLDLEDQLGVRVADVWAGYADRVGAAAARYASPLLLLGRSYASGERWTTHWSLSGEAVNGRWVSDGLTLEQTLAGGVNELANWLGQRFAVASSADPQRVVIRVFGIEDMSHYGQVVGYLKSLSMVINADPLVVAPDYTDFALFSDSGVSGLIQALQYGRVLSRVDRRLFAGDVVDLTYRVNP